jgi:anti-sigma factor RsiW
MFRNYKHKLVERYFDGDGSVAEEAERLIAEDAGCADHYAFLQQLRTGARNQPKQEVSDLQMGAFLAGIREQIAEPAPRHAPASVFQGRSLWAGFSLAAAALLVAVSTLYIVSGDTAPVQATEVESISTDIVGATTSVEYGPEGGATLWINLTGDDL